MESRQIAGRELARARVRARAKSMVKVCLETLEDRRLLAGYGEIVGLGAAGGGPLALVPAGVVATWAENGQVYTGVFDLAWNRVSGAQAVDLPGRTAGDLEIGSAADGRIVAAWTEYPDDRNIWARRFSAAGAPEGDPFVVAWAGVYTKPALAVASDGRFVVTYTAYVPERSAYGVFAKWYSAAGDDLSGAVQIAEGPYDFPAVAMGPSGETVFVWSSSGRIYGRLYGGSGASLGEAFPLSTSANVVQRDPSVAMDDAGRWVACWQGGSGVVIRRFDASGSDLDPLDYDITTSRIQQANTPRIAMAGDGRFAATWEAGGLVYGRRFDATGLPVDEDAVVGAVSGGQSWPHVVMAADGDTIFGWHAMEAVDKSQAVRFGPGRAPMAIALSNSTMFRSVRGSTDPVVGRLSTTDFDAGDTFTYSLPAGVGDNARFEIVGDELRRREPADAYSSGDYSVTVQVRDSSGWMAERTFEVVQKDEPPTEWWPLYAGLSTRARGVNNGISSDLTLELLPGDVVGLVQRTADANGHSDSRLVQVGTTWYATGGTFQAEGGDEQEVMFSSAMPAWDERVAAGRTLRWSRVLVSVPPYVEAGLVYTGPTLTSGSVKKVRIGQVILQNGLQFDRALVVREQSVMSAPATYQGRSLKVVQTVTTEKWFVRGVGQVKSTQVTKLTARSGSRTIMRQSGAGSAELTEVPDWAQFTALADGTLTVSGTGAADRIRCTVSGADLMVNRNGVYSRAPLGSVQKIVIIAMDGNDVVDMRGIGLPVEVEGGAGNDQLYGGDGNDSLTGGDGKDVLQGQNGDDWIDARDEVRQDQVSGGAGRDTAYVDIGEKSASVENRVDGQASALLGRVEALDLAGMSPGVL